MTRRCCDGHGKIFESMTHDKRRPKNGASFVLVKLFAAAALAAHCASSAAGAAAAGGAAFPLIPNQLKHNGTDNQEKKEGNEDGSQVGYKP